MHEKKLMVDQLLEVKVLSPLLNVWKFFRKLMEKHRRVQKQTFQQVSKILKIFGNLQKNRRMSPSAQNNLPTNIF